jgi:hypothetical protein
MQDRSVLAGSNLRLRNGVNYVLGAGGGNITLKWIASLGDWVQISGEVVGTATPTATPTGTATNTATATPTP